MSSNKTSMTVMVHTDMTWNSYRQKKQKKNKLSPNVALLCAGVLGRGVVYDLERVLQVCDGFFSSFFAFFLQDVSNI